MFERESPSKTLDFADKRSIFGYINEKYSGKIGEGGYIEFDGTKFMFRVGRDLAQPDKNINLKLLILTHKGT